MREVTDYERHKWFDEYGRFKIYPEFEGFLQYGDEYGEAFNNAARATHMEDYGLPSEYVKHAEIVVLDMYYYQATWFYQDKYDEPEDFGLPTREEFLIQAKALGVVRLSYDDAIRPDNERVLWDWAMKWREDNREENQRKAEIKRHEHQLSVLRGEEDGS